MKKNIVIGLLAIAIAGFTINNQRVAADNPRQPAATVILGYKVANGLVNGVLQENGMKIKWVSRSENVPEIPIESDIAPVMAWLLDNGFVMEPPSPRPEYVFNRRPR